VGHRAGNLIAAVQNSRVVTTISWSNCWPCSLCPWFRSLLF